MSDQQQSTAPKSENTPPPPQPPSQAPFPTMMPEGVFSPATEKQVSELLAEMQQYATTAAPGVTTTMNFSYQKSKHTTETTGQEPQVVESSKTERSVHQSPPPEQPQQPPAPAVPEAAPAPQTGSIFSQIPQFLQEKLGFGGGAGPVVTQQQQQQQQGGQQHTEVKYHHSKKTTTTTTTSSSGDEQKTVSTTESEYPPAPAPTPAQEPAHDAPQAEGGFLAPLKNVAEKLQEQVGHIPEMLQEKFGIGQQQPTPCAEPQRPETDTSQMEISYQHTKKTTTTSSSSTTSSDQQHNVSQQEAQQQQQQPTAAPEEPEKPSLIAPLKEAAGKVASGLEHMMEQAAKAFPHAPEHGNMQIEFSKHESRQVMSQTGEQPPNIETTSSGYTQVVQGIFDGTQIVGGVVPVIVSKSVSKSETAGIEAAPTPTPALAPTPAPEPCGAAPAPTPAPSGQTTTSTDGSSQLEEQLKKLGIAAGHPMSELLQQTLSQHQRAKTPESNIEIQYSAQRTHSSRTVTYETTGTDAKSAQEALHQLQQGTLGQPSQSAPDQPDTEPKPEITGAAPQEPADQPPTQG